MEVKMNSLSSFLSVNRSADEALDWLSQSLSRKGLRVLRTFDLHDARGRISNCRCPHHGTNECDCQMVVLLVYGNEEEPVTLMLHGNDGQTWLSIVNNSLQHAAPAIQLSIEQALQLDSFE
jgi:hypothetical protein